MSYRDIMVQVDGDPGSGARAKLAASLAARSKAKLTGVFLRNELLRSYMAGDAFAYLPPADMDSIFKDHAAALTEAEDAARAIFEAAAAEAGVASDWRTMNGDSELDLVACARRVDLTVFPPLVAASLGISEISAADLGLASGGPVLITPETIAAPAIGQRVLVAWKGNRESSRALRDAMPFIESAAHVTVLTVVADGTKGSDPELLRHLESHGCKPQMIVEQSQGRPSGDIIRSYVGVVGADLLVMGLYGRPRVQELVLGGVSRDLVRNPPVPLLVSH